MTGAHSQHPVRTGKMKPADSVQLVVFAVTSVLYALYMAGVVEQRLYFIALVLLVSLCLARILWRGVVRHASFTSMHFGRASIALLAVSVLFVGWTALREFLGVGSISTTSLTEAFYLVAPTLIALAVANTVPSMRIADAYMVILLARYVLYFLLQFDLNLQSISQISWSSSQSPFETSFAHDLLMLQCYFLFRGRRLLMVTAGAFTMLGLKRASFVLAPLIVVFRRRLVGHVPPSRKSLVGLWLVGTLSPFVVMWTYSAYFGRLFEGLTARNFDEFSSGRGTIFKLATTQLDSNFGFGWVNRQLAELTASHLGTVWNSTLHNDTVRLYLEVTIIGLALYVGALVFAARSSRMAYFMTAYAMFVLVTSRLITHMSFWIVLFLAIALIERNIALGGESAEGQNQPARRPRSSYYKSRR